MYYVNLPTQDVKHKLLFILEMLDPFIDPSVSVMTDAMAFGDVSVVHLEKQASACNISLNIIRTAVKRPAVLPSLELEWRRGAVATRLVNSICLHAYHKFAIKIDLNLSWLMRTRIVLSLFNCDFLWSQNSPLEACN